MVAFWIALAVLVLGIVGGIVVALLRGFAAWRQVRATTGALTTGLDRVAAAAGEIEGHLAAASDGQARLAEARERLAVSRATLDVHLAAFREAQGTLDRLLWFRHAR